MSCGFQGNSDVFGVGLRTAYYLQILSVWFSNYFYHREIKTLRAVNNVFLLAVVVALFVFFLNPHEYHVIEAYLLVQIGTETGMAGITEYTRYSNKYRATSTERLVIRMLIMIAGGIFWTFLWWRGLDIMIPTPCGTYVFWFAKINMYGWFRTLMKIVTIYGVTISLTYHLANDAGALFANVFARNTKAAFVKAVKDQSPPPLSKVLSTQALTNNSFENIKYIGTVQRKPVSKQTLAMRAGSAMQFGLEKADHRSLLDEVDQAERYIESLNSIYITKDDSFDEEPNSTRNRLLALLTPWKNKPNHTDDTPMLECFKRWILSFATNNPPLTFKIVLYLHGTATGNAGPGRIFRTINRMYILSLSNPPPDWRKFKIASDIQLSKIPCTTSKRTWANLAISRLFPLLWLIVQVELTIVWNQISGLQSFSNLGQLIPFIIALGGLLKVLWGKGRLVWEGKPHELAGGEADEYEMAIRSYVEGRGKEDLGPRLQKNATF